MRFCTIVTANRLQHAEALGLSLQATHPGAILSVLVPDLDDLPPPDPCKAAGLSIIPPDRLDVIGFEKMRIYYDAFELCCALKPTLIKHLMIREGLEKVVYLDSDIWVTGSLHEADAIIDRALFSFTPHLIRPCQLDAASPYELELNDLGIYNGGFWAFRQSKKSLEILDWLEDRLRLYGFDNRSRGMFVDQKWLPMVSALYNEDFISLNRPTYNVAYWNLNERRLGYRDPLFTIDGEPAVFFHFSGFVSDESDQFTVHCPLDLCRTHQGLKQLKDEYKRLLDQCRLPPDGPYRFDYHNGRRLSRFARRYYFHHGRLPRSEMTHRLVTLARKTIGRLSLQPLGNR